MRASLNIISSTVISDDPRLPLPVQISRLKRSRRLRLRVDHDARLLKLTMPWRHSARAALEWVAGQRPWIDRQLAAAPAGAPLREGATVAVEGVPLTIVHHSAARRGVRIDGGALLVGGPAESVPAAVPLPRLRVPELTFPFQNRPN